MEREDSDEDDGELEPLKMGETVSEDELGIEDINLTEKLNKIKDTILNSKNPTLEEQSSLEQIIETTPTLEQPTEQPTEQPKLPQTITITEEIPNAKPSDNILLTIDNKQDEDSIDNNVASKTINI